MGVSQLEMQLLGYIASNELSSRLRETGEIDPATDLYIDKEYFQYGMPQDLKILGLKCDELLKVARGLKNLGYLKTEEEVRDVDSAEYDVRWFATEKGRQILNGDAVLGIS